MTKKEFLKELSIRLSLLFFAFILFLLIGEIAARIFIPKSVIQLRERQMYSDILQSDPVLRRVLKPNHKGRIITDEVDFTIKTNSKGLRDRDFSYQKDEDTTRFLLLGDSFTFGYGVEGDETYPKLLEEKFKKEFPDRKIEVINAGITGWGTSQYSDYLKTEGIKYNPDIILVGFYINDVVDTFVIKTGVEDSIAYWERIDKSLIEFAKDKPTMRLQLFLNKHSNFYVFLQDKVSLFFERLEEKKSKIGKIHMPDFRPWNVDESGISLVDLEKSVEEEIKIYSFKVHSLSKNKARLKVWRQTEEGDWVVMEESDLIDLKFGTNSIRLKKPLLAQKGDYLGLFISKGNISRNIPYEGSKVYSWGDVRKITNQSKREDRAGGYSFQAYFEASESHENQKSLMIGQALAKEQETQDSQKTDQLLGDIAENSTTSLYRPQWRSNTQEAWQDTMNLLLGINETGKSIGAKVIFVYLPSNIEIEGAIAGEVVLDKPENLFCQFMEENKLDFIDLVPRLRSSSAQSLYFPHGHFDENGHFWVSEGIFEELTARFMNYFYENRN